MKQIYFTPGPSQLYPTVSQHIKYALDHDLGSISHRSQLFQDIFAKTVRSLRALMHIPKTHHVFFLPSSLESMERIIQNTVEKYSFHFVNGAFSKKWYQFSVDLHKKPEKFEVDPGNGFDFTKIKIPRQTELICITQNETSTGVSLPIQDIYNLHKRFPQPIIALDIVSSAPYPLIDFSYIDMAFFSVQKGFGMPAGLDVLIINDRAIKQSLKVSKKVSIGTYHSLPSLLSMAEKNQTPETPNVLFIYVLGKVCQDMLKKGISKIRREVNIKAKSIYDFAEKSNFYKPFVREKRYRSTTTIDLKLINKTSDDVVMKLKKKGLIIDKGYGEFKGKHIRIANFPQHSSMTFKKLCAALRLID